MMSGMATVANKGPKMNNQNSLPDVVWYLGGPIAGTSVPISARRTDGGPVYTFVWRQEQLAKQFVGKLPKEEPVNCAPAGMILGALICSPVKWVLIDPPAPDERLLDDPSVERLDCGRSADVWPYILASGPIRIPEERVGDFRQFLEQNPELSPRDVLPRFTALMQERLEHVNQTIDRIRTYAVSIGKDPDEVIRALNLFGMPEQPCSKCNETLWKFEVISPNAASCSWSCGHCGKTLVVKAKSSQDQGGRLTREPIPKTVQREVWQRDQGRCVQCGSKENLEFDHIIPVARGGANTARNLQLLCEPCNRSKGDSEPGT